MKITRLQNVWMAPKKLFGVERYLSIAGDQIVKKSFFRVIPSGFINQNKYFGP
jgi:hypothetical protein